MKYLSIIVLAFFINFTALPGLAAFFDWDIPSLSTNITEEEIKNNLANYNEKVPPKPYNFKDLLNILDFNNQPTSFLIKDDSTHLSPFLTIFSPPPEA